MIIINKPRAVASDWKVIFRYLPPETEGTYDDLSQDNGGPTGFEPAIIT
jgi:hypothetical protein